MKSHFTIEKDEEALKSLEGFKSVFDDEIESEVSFTAALSRRQMQRHQSGKFLPGSNEIHLFASFLMNKRNDSLELFNNDKTYENWISILSLTAVLLILYNRRRSGETGKALIKDFENRKKGDPSNEFFQMLPDGEKKQRLKYSRMDIQGKRADGAGQLFLSQDNENALHLCMKWRGNVGVDPNNEYLFGVRNNALGEHDHLRLYNLLVKFANECSEVENIDPTKMRGNNLRHQLATLNSTIDGGSNLKSIAHHMGHSEKTHNKYYRHTIDEEDVTTTSILDKINKISPCQGKINFKKYFARTEEKKVNKILMCFRK